MSVLIRLGCAQEGHQQDLESDRQPHHQRGNDNGPRPSMGGRRFLKRDIHCLISSVAEEVLELCLKPDSCGSATHCSRVLERLYRAFNNGRLMARFSKRTFTSGTGL